MRILLLTHSLEIGGTEVVASELARWLRRRGYYVEVGCLDSIGILGERLRAESFEVTCYMRRPGKDVGLPFRIANHLRRSAIDVVHAHQTTCYVYGLMAAVLAGVAIVFTEHGRFHPDTASALRRVFNRTIGARVNAITAVSKKVRESLVAVEGFSRDRIEVVYNGIDLSRFETSAERRAHARRLLGLPNSAPVVGTVGRLDPDKNHSLFLRAVGSLRDEIPAIRAAVIGGGPERFRLETLSRDLGLDGQVNFLGERSDVDRLLPGLDVFALTSVTEGMPITLLEAMAARVPIVSTAVGGIPEVVADGSEALLLAPPIEREDPSLPPLFARLLAAPLVDPALGRRLAASARNRVEREFSLESSFKRYERLYHSLSKAA